MMIVAVLGATGLIGQHAARAVLARGHRLRVVHRAGSRLATLAGLAFEARVADLDDRAALIEALAGADAVIHCAGYVPRANGAADKEIALARRQMENFCAAVRAAGCARAVYVSAGSVLNKPANAPLADETMLFADEPEPENLFRLVKWHLEQVAQQEIAAGLPLVIAIPAMVFGAYDHGPTAGKLIVGIANRSIRHVIDCPRNVIAGADVAEGLLRCLEAGRPGERYLLAGANLRLPELAARIAAAAGVKPPRAVPLPLALGLAWLQEWRFRLIGTPAKIRLNEVRILAAGRYLNPAKASRELAFTATTPVDQAIAEALAWFRETGMLAPATTLPLPGSALPGEEAIPMAHTKP